MSNLYVATMQCYMDDRFVSAGTDEDYVAREVDAFIDVYLREPRVMVPSARITLFASGRIWKTKFGGWDVDAELVVWGDWQIVDDISKVPERQEIKTCGWCTKLISGPHGFTPDGAPAHFDCAEASHK